jgi:tight adherence protein B
MVLLALLPTAGPAIGLLFGLTPLELYGSSPAASLCLVVGAVLGLVGWLWSRAIVGRALRPSTVGDDR